MDLITAAKKGKQDLTYVYLKNGVDTHFHDHKRRTALSWAAGRGYKAIVQQIIATDDASLNSKDINGRTPLWWASTNGHEAVIKLLLAIESIEPDCKDKDLLSPLSIVASKGFAQVVKLLLSKSDVEPDSRDSQFGRTPLSWAAQNGHEETVKILLAKDGVDLRVKDKSGWTPLSLASKNGHETVVKLLLMNGADVKAKDKSGRTPLSLASENGHETVVKLLLMNGADVKARDKCGQTPLLWAAGRGHEAVVKLLVMNGADFETKDKDAWTPLLWAAKRGHEDMVTLLLENGADVKVKGKGGRTPLSSAVEMGHEAVVKLLLENGADIEAKYELGRTPLSSAAERGHKGIVTLLLESGADVKAKDKSGRTPLLWAAETPLLWASEMGHEAVVELLLINGADIEAKDKLGRTPLSSAAERGHKGIVTVLLKNGADVKAKDNSGRTPLLWAVEMEHEAVVKLLLENGADIEAKYELGRTPLSSAAERGHKGIVTLLLESGADVKAKDKSGRTPLSWAAEREHKSRRRRGLYEDYEARRRKEAVVKLLLKNRADIEAKDELGRTPLVSAAESGDKDMIKILLNEGAKVEAKDTEYSQTQLSPAADKRNKANAADINDRADSAGYSHPATSTLYADPDSASVPSESRKGKETSKIHLTLHQHVGTIIEEESEHKESSDIESDKRQTDFAGTFNVPPEWVATFVSEFSRDLRNAIPQQYLDEAMMERLDTVLPELLKDFVIKFGHDPPTTRHREIMYLVCQNRFEISSQFQEIDGRDAEARPKVAPVGNDLEVPLGDKISLWDQNTSGLNPDSNIQSDMLLSQPSAEVDDGLILDDSRESSLDDEGLQADTQDFQEYRDCIAASAAYGWLVETVKKQVLLASVTERNIMRMMRQEIMSCLPIAHKISREKSAGTYKMTFQVRWDPLAFLKEQDYRPKPDNALEMAITLTGSAKDAQALTCAQYLCQTWPSSGKHTIRLIKHVVNTKNGRRHSCNLPDGTELIAWIDASNFMVEVLGKGDSIAQVGEQLAWLAAALRSSPTDEPGVASCTPFIDDIHQCNDSSGSPTTLVWPAMLCKIDFTVQTKAPDFEPSNGQCWHNVFRNPVVVEGYPIPRRSEPNTGLEISLNIMAGLVGTKRVNTFNGYIFIKGFSAMLVPTRNTGDLLIWHLLYKKDGNHISYLDNTVAHAQNLIEFELEEARHIIGWCSEVKYCAGAADAVYPTKETSLPRPRPGCVLGKAFIRWGRLVIGDDQYVIGHKDRPNHVQFSRGGDIQKLKWIHEKFVVLWDEVDKRGWLVNGTSALLHLVRASLDYDSHDAFSSLFCFKQEHMKEADIQHTHTSALKVLLNPTNKELKLYPEKKDFIRLSDRVDHLYDIMDKIITYQEIITGQNSQKWKSRARKYLEGWDFRDIAKITRDPIYPRVAKLQAFGKAWVDFTRDIGAVVLFGRGFGEIFRPGNINLCPQWAQLPKERYYLAACVSDLKGFIAMDDAKKGTPMTRIGNMIWHNPDKILEQCQCTGTETKAHCDPVQVLLPPKFRGSLRWNPIQLGDHDAVIFGQNSTFRWFWTDIGDPLEGESPLASEESESEFNDSGIGENSSTSGASSLKQYKIGIVCALPKELKAIRALFDSQYEEAGITPKDTNQYALGRIGEHNIVAACLPYKEYGTNSAAAVISNMYRSFVDLQHFLLVGIGGGVPLNRDMRLGDVVVSIQKDTIPAVIQYDFNKMSENGVLERIGLLHGPPPFWTCAISNLMANPDLSSTPLQADIEKIVRKAPEYKHPGSHKDRLFASRSKHDPAHKTCEWCGAVEKRPHRLDDHPRIHYGPIASGNQLMKDAQIRDRVGAKHNVLCFEMEAAGAMNVVPCLVIRGICDYADSHKNDLWQEYASATAASYAKLLLSNTRNRSDMESMPMNLDTVTNC
ncbi:hypothetical protein QQS21_010122 [Conoideocrella luteorostrata]|uniref:Nucleoside phosphorylase domain-containing protein n=1 Tax=Conoideocrella luteorostrata TaxID=1105319 RepID=A0AAJ0CFY1_9HYPO|nr:hypothetical protein QQS21_010122 [Conoideocrella luteorostrata]